MGQALTNLIWGREFDALAHSTHFTMDELHALHTTFQEFAKANKGGDTLSPEQMSRAFYKCGVRIDANNDFWKHMFHVFDADHDGKVNFRDFATGLSTFSRGSLVERLDFSFRVYDLTEDGQVTREEMKTVLLAMYKAAHYGKVPKNDARDALNKLVDDVFEESDVSHSGTLSITEYRDAVVLKHPNLVEFISV